MAKESGVECALEVRAGAIVAVCITFSYLNAL